ncbi:hypothetical protein JCM19240_765 [Vibrio maritimus]|uniref:Uncharacterized protein n=1 Tax=Vibrio maritimus TaxID=990268 RepID=A0A090TRZ4_9VIBR|nr:hypothetical protein JCM19240_765 [Vibrio maritimus]
MSTIRVSGRWRSNNSNALLQACEEGLGIATCREAVLVMHCLRVD